MPQRILSGAAARTGDFKKKDPYKCNKSIGRELY